MMMTDIVARHTAATTTQATLETLNKRLQDALRHVAPAHKQAFVQAKGVFTLTPEGWDVDYDRSPIHDSITVEIHRAVEGALGDLPTLPAGFTLVVRAHGGFIKPFLTATDSKKVAPTVTVSKRLWETIEREHAELKAKCFDLDMDKADLERKVIHLERRLAELR